MKFTMPALLLLHHRGVTRVWVLWWLIAWAAAISSAQVAIPRIGPGTSTASRSLEQLGAIGLCLPLILIAILVQDRSHWLTATSPRSTSLIRMGAVALTTSIGLFSAMIAVTFYPGDIRWLRLVGLFALLLALTLITGRLIGATWAAFAGPAFVITNTVPGLVPWEGNIVYNPATDQSLVTAGIIGVAVALATAAIPHAGRMGTHHHA